MADFIGPMPYSPSTYTGPVTVTPTTTVAPSSGGGLFGAITSAFGTIANAVTSDKAQRAFTNVASAVNTWRELDVRNEEASTAQKLAMMAQSWLQPQNYPSAATAPYVEASASAPSNAGPSDSGGQWNGTIHYTWLLAGALLFLYMNKGR